MTKKGQVTIPLEFRQLLGLRTGEKVLFEIEDGKVLLQKAPQDPVGNLIGLGKGVFGDALKFQKKIREDWEER